MLMFPCVIDNCRICSLFFVFLPFLYFKSISPMQRCCALHRQRAMPWIFDGPQCLFFFFFSLLFHMMQCGWRWITDKRRSSVRKEEG